jgi:fatty acid desaturase
MQHVPQLSSLGLAVELLRPLLLLALFVWLCVTGRFFWAVPAAGACCFAAFVLLHDTMHSALGLPRGVNELVVGLSGFLLLKSGHALRVTHLRHHGKTLQAGDPEGAPVRWALGRVLWAGPFHILSLRVHALRIDPRSRATQLAETLVTVIMAASAIALYVATGNPGGLVYWFVAATVSATMALWAAYLPHRAAEHATLVARLARYTRAITPVFSSFVFHELHHDHPRVPTACLPALSRHHKA